MIGGKMSGDKREKVLDDCAREGWQLKAITSVEVQGASDRAAWRASWSPSSDPRVRSRASGLLGRHGWWRTRADCAADTAWCPEAAR
jgi:hypothetical protein